MKKSLDCLKCKNALNHAWCETGIQILKSEGMEVTEKETVNIHYPYADIMPIKRFEYVSKKINTKVYGIDIYEKGVDDFNTYTVTSVDFISDEKIVEILDEIFDERV